MSKIIHDLIKIKYVNEGYLPNWPYHMISNEEMCDAFLRLEQDENSKGLLDGPHYYRGYFFIMYPLLDQCLNTDLTEHYCNDSCTGCMKCTTCGNCAGPEMCRCCKKCKNCFKCGVSATMAYSDLVKAIHYYIYQFKESKDADPSLPDWVYSYMLGSTISVMSPILDIHDLIHPLDVDNVDDIFGGEQSIACYKTSKAWIRKVKEVDSVSFSPVKLSDDTTEFLVHNDYIANQVPEDVVNHGVRIRYNATSVDSDDLKIYVPDKVNLRPSTMFGEPHVIKSVRVNILDPMRGVINLQ